MSCKVPPLIKVVMHLPKNLTQLVKDLLETKPPNSPDGQHMDDTISCYHIVTLLLYVGVL